MALEFTKTVNQFSHDIYKVNIPDFRVSKTLHFKLFIYSRIALLKKMRTSSYRRCQFKRLSQWRLWVLRDKQQLKCHL